MSAQKPSHHIKQQVCATRPPYREGRHAKSVKVYTVNNESIYLLIQGVPSVGANTELHKLCSTFGHVAEFNALDDYPSEDKYNEVYLVKFSKIQCARFAKRKLDDYSFFGGVLHVCYAPEYETIAETKWKLLDRRRVIETKIRQLANNNGDRLALLPGTQQHSMISVDKTFSSGVSGTVHQSIHSFPVQNQQYSVQNQQYSVQSQQHSFQSQHFPIQNQHFSILSHQNQFTPCTNYPLPGNLTTANIICQSTNRSASDQPGIKILTDHSENMLPTDQLENRQSVLVDQTQTFQLLPPPKLELSQKKNNAINVYEFSRVCSSHATLPPGFDARLVPHSLEEYTHPNTAQSQITKHETSFPHFSVVLGSNVIIKNYKLNKPRPRFVPRQAIKSTPNQSQPRSQSTKYTDPLDQEIRKNAFHLGETQGPALMPPRKRALIAGQKSVNDTINEIRNKISKVITQNVMKQNDIGQS